MIEKCNHTSAILCQECKQKNETEDRIKELEDRCLTRTIERDLARKANFDLHDKLKEAEGILRNISICPVTLDEATLSKKNIEKRYEHAVVNISCHYSKWKALLDYFKDKE